MTVLRWVVLVLFWLLSLIGLAALVLVSLLSVPLSPPPPLESIRNAALAVDRSGLPELSYFQARDGSSLAYRVYPPTNDNARNIVIVIHGSAGHSTSMNEIAKRLAADNFLVIAPDIRGHGGSGTRGDIGYYGQLDDDLDDLLAELRQRYRISRFALLGFSSGGGFALRLASGKLSSAFERVVLLSPYLGYDAPSTRSSSSSAVWTSPDIPRIMALSLLRRVGFTYCEAYQSSRSRSARGAKNT